MPKDWLRYKAEVHRLYIVEEKTVYQVREILKAKFGFSASVRAYRMKFDHWDMRKYKSQKTRSDTTASSSAQAQARPEPHTQNQTPTQKTSHFPLSPAAAGDFNFSSPVSLPFTDVTMGDVGVDYVREPPPTQPSGFSQLDPIDRSDPLRTLKDIFLHWEPDAEFNPKLITYFQDPEFNKWVTRDPGPETPAVFKLIKDHVPEIDQFALTKLLLEADLSTRHDANHVFTPWQGCWYQVCDASGWEEAKELLYEERILSRGAGIFPSCAEVVLAERLLQSYTIKLMHWSERPPHELELAAKLECTKGYREILSSFHHAKEDVSPRFYRFLLRFEMADPSSPRHKKYENEYRQKYLQLSVLRSRRRNYEDDDEDDEEDEEAADVSGYFGISKPTQPTMPDGLPLTPPTPEDSKFRQQAENAPTMTTQNTLETLISKWDTLSGFQSFVLSLLAQENSVLPIFAESTISSPDNIFDAIVTCRLDAEDRISFARAILIASSAAAGKFTRVPWLLQWLCNIYPPSQTRPSQITFETFHASLITDPILLGKLSEVIRSPAARKLFHDAAVCLAGERLLVHLKSRMRRGRKGWIQGRKHFLDVLNLLRERGSASDQTWTTYLFDSN